MHEIATDDQEHLTAPKGAAKGDGLESMNSSERNLPCDINSTGRVDASNGASSRLPLVVLGAMVVIAAILRIIAAHNDLWLDEIISLDFVNGAKSPWQIFTAIHSDNNHYLNSLYLYFLKNQDDPIPDRLLSVLFGVCLVPAGYWLLARRSRIEGVILAGLLACSYPLIHFSSEARGYAGALLGTVLACGALTRWLTATEGNKPSLWLGFSYGAGLVLAILSHLTACLIWLPLAVGSLFVVLRKHGRREAVVAWTGLNLLPAGVLAALYLVDLRFVKQLGGAPLNPVFGLGRLLAIGLGWPLRDAVLPWLLVGLLAAIAAWQLATARKSNEPLFVLLPLIYLVPIASALALIHTQFFSPRYFLVVLPFVYVGAAILLARLFETSVRKVVLAVIVLLFLSGQMFLYAKFLQVGRGQFTAALDYIKAHTASTRLIVTSNQDFRSRVELTYYGPRIFRNWEIFYVPKDSVAIQPDWYILHEEGYEQPGSAALNVPGQPTWYRVAYFGASELSGQAWTIYAHQPIK